MPGFSNVSGDESIMYADNCSFDGTERGGKMTTDGELWIGNTSSPHVRTGSITSPLGTIDIGYSAPDITIDLSGGGDAVDSLTPDFNFDGSAANPVLPQLGNINLLSYNPSVANVTNTYNSTGASTGNFQIEHKAWLTALVVDPSSTIGTRGTFQTIASALSAASSGQDIFIRPGTYTENLTLKAGVNLVGFMGDGFTPNVTISGTLTMTVAGTCTISGIRLETNAANFLAVTGSAASIVNLVNCFLNVTSTSTGISHTSSSGSTQINLHYCSGNITSTGIFFTSTAAGGINFFFTEIKNTGGSTNASTVSTAIIGIRYSSLGFPLTTSSAGSIDADLLRCVQPGNTTAITTAGTGTSTFHRSFFASNTASAISIGAGTTVGLTASEINSSNTNVITGAGTLTYSGISYSGTSSGVNVTTQNLTGFGPSLSVGSTQTGLTNSLTVTNPSNTASSAASIIASVGGGTAADPVYQAVVSGVTTWSWGADNSVTSPTADTWVLAQGTALGTNNVMSVATSGEINYPLQPAFMAFLASTDANATGDGTTLTLGSVTALTEIFDQNGDFVTTGTFTAPVTGKYQLGYNLFLQEFVTATHVPNCNLTTSNRVYNTTNNATGWTGNNNFQCNVLADMDAADTAFVSISVSGGAKVVDVFGAATNPRTYFYGSLEC